MSLICLGVNIQIGLGVFLDLSTLTLTPSQRNDSVRTLWITIDGLFKPFQSGVFCMYIKCAGVGGNLSI